MLSGKMDGHGGNLSREQQSFLERLPPLVYVESGERFGGPPKTIIFSDPIRYYDELGLELEPLPDRFPLDPCDNPANFLIERRRCHDMGRLYDPIRDYQG